MIDMSIFHRFTLGLAILFAFPQTLSGAPIPSDGTCPGVFDDGKSLKILTLNILFSEYAQREQRLSAIADFIARRNIHLVALQEVVGGVLDEFLADRLGGTPVDGNTAKEIQRLLEQNYGQRYNLRTAFSSGLPGLLSVSNAVLSRCKITGKLVARLPAATELEIGDLNIELGRSLLMTRIDIPGWGKLNVYNVHLCPGNCSDEDRLAQAKTSLDFIEDVQALLPSRDILFAGDFNTNVPRLLEAGDPNLPRLYRRITQRHRFIDTYAQYARTFLGLTLVCVPEGSDQGCTRGVSNIGDPFDRTPEKERIDYIFSRGKLATIQNAEVVFNPLSEALPRPPGVSDHSGVFTRLRP